MEGNLLSFLGKDSGFGEKNNSAYIDLGNKLIIIDCGFTVFPQIKNKFNLGKYCEIEVIITHLHNDHAGSLSQLILYAWYVFNKKIIVYSSCKNMKKYLDITGVQEDIYELRNGSSEKLQFIKTQHVDQIDSYGFMLQIYNKKIVYTGDTSTLIPFLPYIELCDELYVDVSKSGGVHLQIDNVAKELNDIKCKGIKVCLMHMDDAEYVQSKIV